MTASELLKHFLDRSPWVESPGAVDKVRYGDPDIEIVKVGVGFSACDANIIKAAAEGCNVFLSHETTFSYTGKGDLALMPWSARKMRLLDEHSMTAMNLHDSWDHFPAYGVRDAFAEALGLGELMTELDYIHPGRDVATTGKRSIGVYSIQSTTVKDFCQGLLRSLSPFGAGSVQYFGDDEAIITSCAIGVGCHIPSFEALYAGAGILVMVYDRALEVGLRIQLAESGANIALIEHSLAEKPSMLKMTRYLDEVLGIPAVFCCEEPNYKYITRGDGL